MTGFIVLFDTVRDFTSHFTVTHTPISTVTTSLPLLGGSFQRWTSPFLWVPELSPVSATSFSQQQLTTTEPMQFSN
jgi:hypothetical protein